MEFELTGEQKALRRTVREFAENEIAPHVRKWDETATFPREIVPKLGELGILGIIFPESYGGVGLGYVESVLAIEELARVDASIALTVAAHGFLCGNHILLAGNKEQRAKYLPGIASGQKLGCWSLTEPEAGSDAAALRTRAARCSDGWMLNGSKVFATNGNYADVFVITAATKAGRGHRGFSSFVVEKGAAGLRLGRQEHKMGMRASDTAELFLEDCRVPPENLLGKEGRGFIDCLRVLDGGRIVLAALAVGLAQGAFETGLRYSRQRRQFGKTISQFQAIQWKLADMATEIEAARLLTFQAAWRKDRGLPMTLQASMAKLFAGEAAVRAAGEALQIHGGYGFMKDSGVEKFYRDAKLVTIGEGTSEIQRLIIARHLLENYG
ncbi:MAG: acyl-CoA dehydrogenase family protein [Acidobacteria bacterium]|nr:acyl-CoA dehydrogenase family protein [Acidobacteriota bacterium]